MTSRSIINLLLILAIAGLAAVAWHKPGIEQASPGQAVTSLTVDQLERVHLQRPVRKDLILTRSGVAENQVWQIQHTPPLPAGDFQIRALLKLAEQTSVRNYPAADLDPGKLELAPARASVTLNDIQIDFGGLEPLQNLRYVRVGSQIHLIPDSYMQLIEAPVSQFVSHRLLDPGSIITSIELPGLHMSKEKQKWLTRPEHEVSSDAMQRFISNWQRAEAVYVKQADASPGKESISIRIENREEPIHFQIAETEPDLVLIRTDFGIQYHMGNRSNDFLALTDLKTNADD